MQHEETTNEINRLYSKWLISFRLNNSSFYTVWGADSTDGDNDKLWVDNRERIILFRNPQLLVEAIETMSLATFDTENLINWALAQKKYDLLTDNVSEYDFDNLIVQIETINYEDLQSIDSKIAATLVNFVNLFGDYANQTNDNFLLEICKNPSIRILWEYTYNANFWTISEEDLKNKQDDLLRDYDAEECKKTLHKMVSLLIERFLIILPKK